MIYRVLYNPEISEETKKTITYYCDSVMESNRGDLSFVWNMEDIKKLLKDEFIDDKDAENLKKLKVEYIEF